MLEINLIPNVTLCHQETNLGAYQDARLQSWVRGCRCMWEGGSGTRLWTVVWWQGHSEIHCCSSVEESVPDDRLEPPGADQTREN